MRLHIIMHESFEAPAAILDWAISKNHTVCFTKLYEYEQLPAQVDSFDFLVVMGGPQSPTTTLAECPYFDSQKEISFIKMAIDQGKAVLGICLGAQMIGEALGGICMPSPNREIGVFDLILTNAGKKDAYFSTLPEKFPSGHWHGDMPGLSAEAEILAGSAGCPRQIIRYKPNVYGFQCHFEFTPEAIEGMIVNCADELATYKYLPYIQDAGALRSYDFSQVNAYLFGFLDYLEQKCE